jgi:uncharacterized membrane protein
MFCDGDMSLGSWIWMAVLWFGFLGLLAAVVVSVSRSRPSRSDSALDARAILDALLARGGVTVDEYRERRAILEEPR